MPDIKTRDVVKGTVKTFDRSFVIADKVKDAYVKTKDDVDKGNSAEKTTVNEYTTNHVQNSLDIITTGTTHQIGKNKFNYIRKAKRNIQKARENEKEIKKLITKKPAKKTKVVNRNIKTRYKGTVKTVDQAFNGIIKTPICAGSRRFKTKLKTIKTAKYTGRVTIKVSKIATKSAYATSKATVKTAKATTKAVKSSMKAMITSIKVAIKVMIAAVKMIIDALKSLILLIIAGGWIAVIIIVIISLLALIVGSCFGIFFANENTGTVNTETLQHAIQEIKTEYNNQIEDIKNRSIYDEVDISGATIQWPEVLSVYAVKTTTDPLNGQEVATMNATKKAILKDIFWQMHTISHKTELKITEVVTETDDGHGNKVQTVTYESKIYLYIWITHKSADEMASQYGFSETQKTQLKELLSNENRSMWDLILNGI